MDAKASARSKHASSQRGRARHSTHKHAPPPQQPSSSHPPGKHTGPLAVQPPPLPSNWSRYAEEEDASESGPSSTELPSVKSKGADYRELLSQRSSTHYYESPDLTSGRNSLMLTRGLDLIGWGLDADSIRTKPGTTADEASFLSLDLDFLGKELAKLNLAERLFIDPKFIPAEEREKSTSAKCEDSMVEEEEEEEEECQLLLESSVISPAREITEDNITASSSPSEELDPGSQYQESNRQPMSHTVSGLDGLVCSTGINESLSNLPQTAISTYEEATSDGLTDLFNKFDIGTTDVKNTTVESKNTENSKFQAKAAEAELDALLDMLDNPHHFMSATGTSNMFPGRFSSQGSSSGKGAFSELPQKLAASDFSGDAFLGTVVNSNIGSLDESLLLSKKNLEWESGSGAIPGGPAIAVPKSGDGKGLPNLAEDFDEWLDSL